MHKIVADKIAEVLQCTWRRNSTGTATVFVFEGINVEIYAGHKLAAIDQTTCGVETYGVQADSLEALPHAITAALLEVRLRQLRSRIAAIKAQVQDVAHDVGATRDQLNMMSKKD